MSWHIVVISSLLVSPFFTWIANTWWSQRDCTYTDIIVSDRCCYYLANTICSDSCAISIIGQCNAIIACAVPPFTSYKNQTLYHKVFVLHLCHWSFPILICHCHMWSILQMDGGVQLNHPFLGWFHNESFWLKPQLWGLLGHLS